MRSKRTRLLLPLLGILFNLTFSFAQVDTTWWDCDCPEPTIEDGVCVTYTYDDIYTGEEFTDTMWMPSECYALCFGFTEEDIVGSCTWEDVYEEQDTTWYDCDCPEPTEEDGVCVLGTYFTCDSTEVTDTFWMPSLCLALCWGYSEEDIIGNCSWEDVYGEVDTTWNDCDCQEPTEEDGVCVLYTYEDYYTGEEVTDTTWMPSECYALCFGFTEEDIVGSCTWEDVYEEQDSTWYDCDCPEPTEEDGVCVLYTYDDIYTGEEVTDTTWMPSTCYALCFGFSEENIVGSCTWDDVFDQDTMWTECDCPEPTEEDGVCIEFLIYGEDSTEVETYTFYFESACIAECYGFTEAEYSYDCDPETANSYFATSTRESRIKADKLNMQVYPNPFNDMFTIDLSEDLLDANITISGVDGRIVYQNKIDTGLSIDGSSFNPGIYFINVTNNELNKTIRLVKMK